MDAAPTTSGTLTRRSLCAAAAAVTLAATLPGCTPQGVRGQFAPVPGDGFAPRLKSLEGAAICFVGNGFWEDDRAFAAIAAYLTETYGCTVFGKEHFPVGNGAIAADDSGIPAAAAALGADAVIVGSAG